MSESSALTMRIEKSVYGGSGLARHEGRVIFTPFTLPGELVTANVTNTKKSFAEARLDSVLEPAAGRVEPPCPYFGICGGCHYQHGDYGAQLAIKCQILTETLTRARLTNLPAIVTHAGQPFGYRNRIRLHLEPGTSALGYRERASHRLLSVDVCPIAMPALEQALQALSGVCATQHCGRVFSEVELSSNHDGSELLLAFWPHPGGASTATPAQLERICEALKIAVPALRGAGVYALHLEEGRRPNATRGSRPPRSPSSSMGTNADKSAAVDSITPEDSPGELTATWGTPSMTYRARGFDYRVSLGAFFQVNHTLVDQLVSLATSGRTGGLAWDLYAGVGLFSRVLAGQFQQVVAVEGAPISSRDLRGNLPAPHQAVRSSTGEFLRRQLAARRPLPGNAQARQGTGSAGQATPPDFVLVDPPRAGLGPDATRMLSEIGPRHITYVSCDPATLARDLQAFVESGYRLQQLHLTDLFPQTFHLEAVAMLSLD